MDQNDLIDALCRAAFAPQRMMGLDNMGNPTVQDVPSPLISSLARQLERQFADDLTVRALVLAELTKPENITTLVGELAKGIGRKRVNDSRYYSSAVEVPDWVKEALSSALVEWLGTDEAAGMIPKMIENGTVKVTVERSDVKSP